MKLSTKSRYGLRAIFDIAYNAGNLPAQVQDISRRQGISPRYLEQIFQGLKRAGILKSKRGPQGGYCLAKKPEDITVAEVLVATERDINLVECAGKRQKKSECCFNGSCVTQDLWSEASNQLLSYFSGITVKDLCDRGQAKGIKREQDHRFMYFI